MAQGIHKSSKSQEKTGANGEIPKKKITDLPPSSDKEFWGEDGEHLQVDTNKPEESYEIPLAGHQWRQQGPYLICKTCPLTHAVAIGINRSLEGFDEKGNPIIKKVADS